MNHCSVCVHKHKKDCIWNCGCEAFELDLAEHDKQIRHEVISDLQNLYQEWKKETQGIFCADEETTKFLKRLKTHINLEEVQLKGEQNE